MLLVMSHTEVTGCLEYNMQNRLKMCKLVLVLNSSNNNKVEVKAGQGHLCLWYAEIAKYANA